MDVFTLLCTGPQQKTGPGVYAGVGPGVPLKVGVGLSLLAAKSIDLELMLFNPVHDDRDGRRPRPRFHQYDRAKLAVRLGC